MPQAARVQIGQVLVFPINARRQDGNFDVERVQILVVVLVIDLDDQRCLRLGPRTHRLMIVHEAVEAFGVGAEIAGFSLSLTSDTFVLLSQSPPIMAHRRRRCRIDPHEQQHSTPHRRPNPSRR